MARYVFSLQYRGVPFSIVQDPISPCSPFTAYLERLYKETCSLSPSIGSPERIHSYAIERGRHVLQPRKYACLSCHFLWQLADTPPVLTSRKGGVATVWYVLPN